MSKQRYIGNKNVHYQSVTGTGEVYVTSGSLEQGVLGLKPARVMSCLHIAYILLQIDF
jgi:hypothetical protein